MLAAVRDDVLGPAELVARSEDDVAVSRRDLNVVEVPVRVVVLSGIECDKSQQSSSASS